MYIKFKLVIFIFIFIFVLLIAFLIKYKNFSSLFNRFKSKNFQKPDIYVYWDSGFEGMKPLIKSIYLNNKKVAEKYNYNYILVTKKNVRQYIDVPDKFFLLKSNFQSDICRYFLLSKYGGVWMDCDILLYRNMDSLIKKKKIKKC